MGNGKGGKARRRAFNREAGVKPGGPGAKADLPMAHRDVESPMFGVCLMEEICGRDNLRAALRRVRSNKGSPGVDGMRVDELAGHLRVHWLRIKEALLNGEYRPQLVRRVEIPKPGKQKRSAIWGSRAYWIDSSSKRCCRFYRANGMGPFLNRVTDSGRVARRIKRMPRPRVISDRATRGWSILTWNHFSTGSITIG